MVEYEQKANAEVRRFVAMAEDKMAFYTARCHSDAWIAAASATAAEKGASGVGVAAMPGTVVYVAGSAIVMAGGAVLTAGSVKTLAQDQYRLLQAEEEARQEAGDTGSEDYYKKGLQDIPDDWIEVEAPEELKIKSESFNNFLREQGYNPKNWRKVVEKWASPDGTIYQRNYWTNGTDFYYHGKGIEEFVPH